MIKLVNYFSIILVKIVLYFLIFCLFKKFD